MNIIYLQASAVKQELTRRNVFFFSPFIFMHITIPVKYIIIT